MIVVDVGNTRCKWQQQDGSVSAVADITALAKALPPGVTVLVASTRPAAISDLRAQRPDLTIDEVAPPWPCTGIYAGMGQDRILAGLGLRTSAIIVDAGTATTIDAWRITDDDRHFLGGLILPGAAACLAGLGTLAPGLPTAAVDAGTQDPLAQATIPAIGNALAIGHPGMVCACVAAQGQATGLTTVVLTGGAVEPLITPLTSAASCRELFLRPDLVVEGMQKLSSQRE